MAKHHIRDILKAIAAEEPSTPEAAVEAAVAVFRKITTVACNRQQTPLFASLERRLFWAWLVRTLRKHVEVPAVVEAGCKAIANLAYDCDNRRILGVIGACEAVVVALRSNLGEMGNEAARQAAEKALANLQFNHCTSNMERINAALGPHV